MWPTPTVNMVSGGANHNSPAVLERGHGINLAGAVKMWPTPTVSGNHNRKGASKNSGDGLATAANFATPQARDYRTGEAHRWDNPDKSRNLNDQVAKYPTPNTAGMDGGSNQRKAAKKNGMYITHPGGKLNPAFVEWLMGWPLQWTSLEPLAIERFNEWFGNAIWWHAEFEDVPRLIQSHPGRVNRLKALGNGQVPFCMATAFRLLAGGMNI